MHSLDEVGSVDRRRCRKRDTTKEKVGSVNTSNGIRGTTHVSEPAVSEI